MDYVYSKISTAPGWFVKAWSENNCGSKQELPTVLCFQLGLTPRKHAGANCCRTHIFCFVCCLSVSLSINVKYLPLYRVSTWNVLMLKPCRRKVICDWFFCMKHLIDSEGNPIIERGKCCAVCTLWWFVIDFKSREMCFDISVIIFQTLPPQFIVMKLRNGSTNVSMPSDRRPLKISSWLFIF